MHPWPGTTLSSLKCSHRSSKFTFLCMRFFLFAIYLGFASSVSVSCNVYEKPISQPRLARKNVDFCCFRKKSSKKRKRKKRSIFACFSRKGQMQFCSDWVVRGFLSLHSGSVCYFDLEASFWRLIKPHSDLCYLYWTTYFNFAILENESKSEIMALTTTLFALYQKLTIFRFRRKKLINS